MEMGRKPGHRQACTWWVQKDVSECPGDDGSEETESGTEEETWFLVHQSDVKVGLWGRNT